MKAKVQVIFNVDVAIDESKFTKEFIQEYQDNFYDFDIKDHLEHIAQLEARDMLMPFTEGYGAICDMGISAVVTDTESEIVDIKGMDV